MKIIVRIDSTWVKDLLRWQHHPDVEKFILGDDPIEDVIARINDGELIFLGLEKEGWRGFATLDMQEDQAELSLFAPGGRAREAVDVIAKLLSRYPVNKMYMKVRADRLKKWELYTKKDWERITRFWGLKFIGLVGDPIGDKPYHILAAKEIEHGQRQGSNERSSVGTT